MKQLVFNEIGSVAIKNLGSQGDGCCLHIKDSILEGATQSGLVNETAYGKSKYSKCFRTEDITFVRVKPGIYTIIDSYIINSREWIADTFKKCSI